MLFPAMMESDTKLQTFRHVGKSWTLVRGACFESKSGYLFTVDESGTNAAVSYQLQLP